MLGTMIGLFITAGLVVAGFSLLPHGTLQGEWPLGIQGREVRYYAGVADLRQIETQLKEPAGEPFYITVKSKAGECLDQVRSSGTNRIWFEAQGYGDSALVKPMPGTPGGYEIIFKDEAPFRGQHGLHIYPAEPGHIRLKYAEAIAAELDLATPAIAYVRVVSCGRELGTYVAEEMVGEGFLARRRVSEAVLFKRSFDPDRPDHLFPAVIGDTAQGPLLRAMLALVMEDAQRERLDKITHVLDEQAAAAWFLMHWLEGAPDPLHQENAFAFHWNRGRFTPVHSPSRDLAPRTEVQRPWARNAFTPWLRLPSFQERLQENRQKLVKKMPELERQFAAVDSTWLPVLANEHTDAMVSTVADEAKQGIYSRLKEGDAIAFLDRPMVEGAGMATLMQGQEVAKRYWPTESDMDGVQAIARKYKARLDGDSLVFPRGKYSIDEDLIIPKGYALILLSGARITMAPGTNILCQGSLFVRGTSLNPVFIRPAGAGYGTVAMMGDGDTPSSIGGLRISGGAGARINGMQHPAMLSIQDASSVRFTECIISGPAGDAALFVHGGTVDMEDMTFLSGKVELREVHGSVRKSTLQGGTRAGGGGMAAHASRLKVEECRFTGIPGTAFEAADGSRVLVRASHFNQCGTAISAVDLGEVHLVDNQISGNRTAISAERRKPLYGGGRIHVYQNDLQRNAKERSADEHSTIKDASGFHESVLNEVVER